MANILFSENWNGKLQCNAFTTIRISNPKYEVGKTYSIFLKGQELFPAKIIEKKRLQLHQINEYIARLDTGYSAEDTKQLIRTIYKNFKFDLDTIYFDFILLTRI
jgi:hypothetical protein